MVEYFMVDYHQIYPKKLKTIETNNNTIVLI
jgi:hypothetical protein